MTNQLLLSLTTGIFIGGVAGYLGTLMVIKRMSVAVDPLSHLVLPGIALALLFHFDVSLGALFSIVLGMILIWFLELKTKLSTETLIAVVFTLGVAFALLILPEAEIEEIFVGDISKINFLSTIISAILSIIIFLIIKRIYSKMILIEISEDLAKVEGINSKKLLFIYLLSVAIIVALGVKIVGGLLTASLIAIPAATAKNLSKNLSQYSFLGIFFGILFPFLGISFFKFFPFSAGILITLVGGFIFLISSFLKKEK
ncbi:MAG: ABC transporter [Candidatus Nealsonbacteria bacterium CG_4_10_14_0_2_um_filter_38_17]|uniref:ABC transporter n=2 Tax=Candidatus Nealsoniibacteriota TaxID=1817911 RepID=A0A2M7UY87_9BACT|nr:MAG: ABC transporter [Candidatus Nealsonbacteria bacterium CG23_combo_of_CG06-09_8_20_14_all_38_19]PIZ88932.1 MAG: ABC transporter [Candidatus Nealsonbacteria bacterium CG_4_10_14_0_2_um_filter_38_17]